MAKNSIIPIGLAKDGHIVWGPYKDEGVVWKSCDVDVCNGKLINGFYGYVSSLKHPYFVGCFGPANYPTFMQ